MKIYIRYTLINSYQIKSKSTDWHFRHNRLLNKVYLIAFVKHVWVLSDRLECGHSQKFATLIYRSQIPTLSYSVISQSAARWWQVIVWLFDHYLIDHSFYFVFSLQCKKYKWCQYRLKISLFQMVCRLHPLCLYKCPFWYYQVWCASPITTTQKGSRKVVCLNTRL